MQKNARHLKRIMLIYMSSLDIIFICRCGGIGRRTGFKIQRETMWVRVPPSVPTTFLFELIEPDVYKNQKGENQYLRFSPFTND